MKSRTRSELRRTPNVRRIALCDVVVFQISAQLRQFCGGIDERSHRIGEIAVPIEIKLTPDLGRRWPHGEDIQIAEIDLVVGVKVFVTDIATADDRHEVVDGEQTCCAYAGSRCRSASGFRVREGSDWQRG